MELKGTIKSVSDIENMLKGSMPYKLVHDGSKGLKVLGEDHMSPAYSKMYQLFPYGGKSLWELRVNVRFYYDRRLRIGTIKISEQGIKLMGKELGNIILQVNGEEEAGEEITQPQPITAVVATTANEQ